MKNLKILKISELEDPIFKEDKPYVFIVFENEPFNTYHKDVTVINGKHMIDIYVRTTKDVSDVSLIGGGGRFNCYKGIIDYEDMLIKICR